MYILISIVFIAELIVACNLISWIIKADKKVCHLNECTEAFNPLAQTFLQYARYKVTNFNESFEKIFCFLRKKRNQIITKTVIMIALYAFLILFKIKFKKTSKMYRMIALMRDLVVEMTV